MQKLLLSIQQSNSRLDSSVRPQEEDQEFSSLHINNLSLIIKNGKYDFIQQK